LLRKQRKTLGGYFFSAAPCIVETPTTTGNRKLLPLTAISADRAYQMTLVTCFKTQRFFTIDDQ